ncbi:MAG: HEAT repeat domain-containing protein [Candidatus Hydrogenedentota bacterium]
MKWHTYTSFVLLFFALVGPATADTIHLQSGASLDGKLEELNQHAVALVTPNGRMVFQRNTIERIEENDRQGDTGEASPNPMAKLHEERLDRITGLNAEQRARVRQLIEPLRLADSPRRKAAVRALVAYGAENPIYDFIEYNLKFMSQRFAPDLLTVLVALDEERAQPLVRARVEDVFTQVRERAIELLAQTEGKGAVRLIARGAIDYHADVRMRALSALGKLDARRATPVLLHGLNSGDRRVANAARRALEDIWNTEHEEDTEWSSFWESRRDSLTNPLQPEELDPLVDEQPKETATYHYE